jgi:hypothetical protein
MIIWRPESVFGHRPPGWKDDKVTESNSRLGCWTCQYRENTRILEELRSSKIHIICSKMAETFKQNTIKCATFSYLRDHLLFCSMGK